MPGITRDSVSLEKGNNTQGRIFRGAATPHQILFGKGANLGRFTLFENFLDTPLICDQIALQVGTKCNRKGEKTASELYLGTGDRIRLCIYIVDIPKYRQILVPDFLR